MPTEFMGASMIEALLSKMDDYYASQIFFFLGEPEGSLPYSCIFPTVNMLHFAPSHTLLSMIHFNIHVSYILFCPLRRCA